MANRRNRSDSIWRNVWLAILSGLFFGWGCNREAPQAENPLRAQAVGSWVAGKPDGPGASATLELKPDNTFAYEFHVGSQPPMRLSGDWIIEDQSLIGQVKTAENGAYKAGDSFPFGQILLLDDFTMKLKKVSSVDEYRRSSAPPPKTNTNS